MDALTIGGIKRSVDDSIVSKRQTTAAPCNYYESSLNFNGVIEIHGLMLRSKRIW